MRTAIVGAGAAGLSLALMLDGDVTVFEKEAEPGGLCRSTKIDGFTFDQGPHILGGDPVAVEWIKESTGLDFVLGITRNVGWLDGRFVEHPFTDPAVGKQYMGKMWKADPDALSTAGLTKQLGRKPGGVKAFLYPRSGGYQAITDAWANKVDVQYETSVPGDGVGPYVWTAPTGMIYNNLTTVTFGYRGITPSLTAVYLPEDWTAFHRISFPSAFAASNAPDDCYSVQGECSWRDAEPDGLLVEFEKTIDKLGLINGPLLMEDVRISPYAYPVPFADCVLGMDAAATVRFHGRTGSHAYLNVDGVVAASMRLAGELNGRSATV